MKKNWLLILTIVFTGICPGLTRVSIADENYSLSEFLFDDSRLATIDVTIDPDSLAWILAEENLKSDHYFRATMRYHVGELDTTVENIGFRLRGNTSRDSKKKSFKISFGEFVDGGRFFGLKKFNLNGEHNDPSIIRSKLAWDLFEQMNVPGSRAVHVKLYINGEYRGLYIHVEEYDKTFVKSRFDDGDGNLFKCLWPADLKYLGTDPNAYKFVSGERRAYELQTNETEDDYSDIARFITILNKASDNDFADTLYSMFDVWNFLKYLAVDMTIGNWDDYWYNKNNYFLYDNLGSGKFEFMAYDCDNTFGISWDDINWSTRNMYYWGVNSSDRPLTYRIFKNQQFKDLYSFFVKKFVTDYFNETTFFQRIDTLKARISSAAYADTYRTMDYGYTVQDFDNSYTTALRDHVKYGLKPYVIDRRLSIFSQIQTVNVTPFVLREPTVSLTTDRQTIIFVDLFDEQQPAEVNLSYKNGEQFVSLPMTLDTLLKDGTLTYFRYRILLPNRLTGDELRYFFSARDNQSKTGLFPFAVPVRTLRFLYPPETLKVFINEFLASNSRMNTDEYGEFDDWIEIFNGDSALNLSGWTLTDDPANPAKWTFPNTILSEGGYLLIWADDQPEQGALHAPFKLDKSGGFIGLFQKIDTTYEIADSFNYDAQETDFSFGRFPDGGQIRQIMLPTPNSGNISEAIGSEIRLASYFSLLPAFPNPFNSQTQIRFFLPEEDAVEVTVIDLFGREVLKIPSNRRPSGWNSQELSFDEMPSGVYFIRVKTGFGNRLTKCVLLK